MSKNRFEFLVSNLCFDDSTTRKQRWSRDRFAAFRKVCELFNNNCAQSFTPNIYMSLDETLCPMRNQIGFKQYNPDKPAKYDMLLKSLNSAGIPYLHRTVVFSSKPEGEANEFYLKGTANYVKFVVSGLQKYVKLNGRNISMDRLYTFIPTTRWLLDLNLTVIGTLQLNRSGIPKEIKSVNNHDDLSAIVYWANDNLNLSSYVVKTRSGKKNVLLLSAMRPIMGVTKDDRKQKPRLYKLYDFTKGGRDECDQMTESYSVKPKSRKWTIASFSYVLDMARINAATVLSLNRKENPRHSATSSFEFIYNLSKSLCLPFFESRSLNGLSENITHKTETITGKKRSIFAESSNKSPLSSKPSNKQRCRECMNEISGPIQKKRKDSLTKIHIRCSKCSDTYYKKHLIFVCKDCYKI